MSERYPTHDLYQWDYIQCYEEDTNFNFPATGFASIINENQDERSTLNNKESIWNICVLHVILIFVC